MSHARAAGILLHPTSLPARFGAGDLGPEAEAFLDWLVAAGVSRWQVLARFYRLPEATIRRFYALELGAADQARLLIGRPPPGLSLRTRLARRNAA